MTRYLISFDDGAMTFPEEDLPAVAQEAKDAGVWVFGGGLHSHEEVSVVATDGTVTEGHPESKAYVGGFAVVAHHGELRSTRVGQCSGMTPELVGVFRG
jgi:hypothetical protein